MNDPTLVEWPAETRPPLATPDPLPPDWCYLCWARAECGHAQTYHSPRPETLTAAARHLAYQATADFPSQLDCWTPGQIALVLATADLLRRYAGIAERKHTTKHTT